MNDAPRYGDTPVPTAVPELAIAGEGVAGNGANGNGANKGKNDKADFGGQGEQDSVLVGKEFGGHSRVAHQKNKPPEPVPQTLPTKKVEEKRGWIEFPKKGTKNPKRYAYRRRWLKKDGRWVKSVPERLSRMKPMSEEDYVKYKQNQERAKRAERRERHRRNQSLA